MVQIVSDTFRQGDKLGINGSFPATVTNLGNVTYSLVDGTMTVTFNTNLAPFDISDFLHDITYQYDSSFTLGEIPEGGRKIRFLLYDGDGGECEVYPYPVVNVVGLK